MNEVRVAVAQTRGDENKQWCSKAKILGNVWTLVKSLLNTGICGIRFWML
jgi:hypothetical protein